MARILVALALLFSLSCRAEAPPAPPPPPPPEIILTDSQVMGCYEHVPGHRPMSHVAPWEMPGTFYLTNDISGHLTNDRWGAVATHGRTLPLRWVRQADTYRATGFWLLERPNTIHIRWTPRGEQGLWVTLRRGSTDDV
jgi:hypothetical protein